MKKLSSKINFSKPDKAAYDGDKTRLSYIDEIVQLRLERLEKWLNYAAKQINKKHSEKYTPCSNTVGIIPMVEENGPATRNDKLKPTGGVDDHNISAGDHNTKTKS